MKKKYLKFIFSGIFLVMMFFVLYSSSNCFAAAGTSINDQMKSAGEKGWGVTSVNEKSMPAMIQVIISALLGMLGIVFLVLLIYAGFMWMTAQGDEEKVTKAKDTIMRAVIGLVIVVAAYSITYFVFNSVLSGESVGSGTTNPVQNTN